ncbi:IPT/TIG domain-containing protein [Hymenobacter sp. BT559]|uniref:IPT/TIG domain-containing protein n=1 Tax=Hymenobacter sp. BT559 TaxID=2795729 RepID=UPI0018EBD8BE|nr:IPT/TIG domain-containing protein [Hymenobacter sp. BT559]MBJ6144711.1 IPT/TIG domain-containing protein [Hymenobacter sp. BT559]
MQLPLPFFLFTRQWASRLRLTLGLLGGSLTAAHAQQPVFGAALTVGNTRTSGESWLPCMGTDAQGNVYVAGHFTGSTYFGAQQLTSRSSQTDIFIAKYDAAGRNLWVRQAGGEGPESVTGLMVDAAGSVYLAGRYYGPAPFGPYTLTTNQPASISSDIFVAKLNAAGTWQWAVSGGGPGDDEGGRLALGSSGQLTLVGSFAGGTATFGPAQVANSQPSASTRDIFVAQLSTDGAWLNAVSAGGAGSESVTDVAVDAAGSTYLCGSFGSEQTQFGAITLPNAVADGSHDAFVAKLSAARTWEWATRFGGAGHDALQGLALDGAGRPYVTGSFTGAAVALGSFSLSNAAPTLPEVVVGALTTDGTWRWAVSAGGPSGDIGSQLTVDAAGQLTVTGSFGSRNAQFGALTVPNASAADNANVFLARLDASGAWQWVLASTGPGEKYGSQLVTAPDGGLYLAGAYWQQATFGATELAGNALFPSIFLVRAFDHIAVPMVSAVAPSSASPGQLVTLTGTGFTGATEVLFDTTPADFTVQSATRLTATVPQGVTAGLVSVRTSAGIGTSPLAFTPTVLATSPASPSHPYLWPNPIETNGLLHIQLPASLAPATSTQVEVRNLLGQLVQQAQFSGRTLAVPLRGVAPGVYQLTLVPAGQPALSRRLTVTE